MRLPAIATMLALAACSASPAEKTADQLDNAAAQSDPAAAEVLSNTAEALRDEGSAVPAAKAQEALDAAGRAQAKDTPRNRQAVPHRSGDPTPPPKTE